MIEEIKDKIIHEPIVLKTEGKVDVKVIKLQVNMIILQLLINKFKKGLSITKFLNFI